MKTNKHYRPHRIGINIATWPAAGGSNLTKYNKRCCMGSWEEARALEEELLRDCEVRKTACGDGHMVWRIWGNGPPLVMLHGGAGSWRHWALNIRSLARYFTLLIADLPGLGDSADPPIPFDNNNFRSSVRHLANIICDGIDGLIGEKTHFKILAFSFGAINSGYIALRMGSRVQHLTLVGAGAMGCPWSGLPAEPKSLRGTKTEKERREVHRHNLGILMIGNPNNIDDRAVYLQSKNISLARLRSYRIAGTDTLRWALEQVNVPISGIWGRGDVYAMPDLEGRIDVIKGIFNSADCRVIEGAGHWVMYEAADTFNQVGLEQLGAITPKSEGEVGQANAY